MRLLAIAAIVALLVIVFFSATPRERDGLQKPFGVETWECAERVPEKPATKSVAWVARDGGLAIFVSSRMSASYIGLSCRVRVEAGRCSAFRSEWKRVTTSVTVGSATETISFDRRGVGASGLWSDTASLSGELAARTIATLSRGSRAEVSVEGQDGTKFSQAINLGGFNEAMNRCGFW